MSDLIQNVKNGVVQQAASKADSSSKSSDNALGKDAFLQLLVTQMKYQDPLNPNTDTEYIAQLATFSQLEQLQNINTVSTNAQTFGLVGKTVIVKAENASGNTNFVTGKVDYVYMNGTKAQLSINGKLYNFSQLDSVIDDEFVIKQGLPGISEELKLTYDGSKPKDLTFTVNMGSGETIADDVAIAIGNKLIDSSLVDVSGNKVTIKSSALEGMENGSYKATLVFNDSLYTTVKNKISLQITNAVTIDNSVKEAANTDTIEEA